MAFAPPRMWSHAVRNDGEGSLWIVGLSDRQYGLGQDEESKDTIRRPVTE
jgi:hypothetical protein